ncbi:MAG: hypothetical protein KME26_16330 [Oscillatoria princeps RMCB-10]|nr:hypothetical protein [Oscillatoria princeps RMCB-10]
MNPDAATEPHKRPACAREQMLTATGILTLERLKPSVSPPGCELRTTEHGI